MSILPLARRFQGDARDHKRAQKKGTKGGRRRPVVEEVELVTIHPDPPVPRLPLHLREVPPPEPLPGRDQLTGAARYLTARARSHARSSPRYASRTLRWSWAGLRRVLALWWHLATSPEHRAMRQHAAGNNLHQQHTGHLSASRVDTVLAVGLAAGVAFVYVAALAFGRLAFAVTVLVTVGVLAVVGRQPLERLAEPKLDDRAPRPDVILKAFEDTGFPGAATVGAPAIEGRGLTRRSRVIVNLGPGRDMTASTAIKRREQLASNLQRDMACVHLSRGGHAGQVILTQLDQDPMTGPPVPSPLLTMVEWSLWDPVPWGFDFAGNLVSLPLLWTSLLVGAAPRMGKTFAIRTLVLAGCLDVHARVYLWDFKGGGDYRAFQPVCAVWGQGRSAKRGQPKAALKMLRDLNALVDERNERIDRLPTRLRPQGKLTREVSCDPQYDLPLILVVLDEVQRGIADPEHGEAIRDEAIALAQNAPSAGVILVCGAQRPTQQTGKGSLGDLPPAMGSRAAFKTTSSSESNVVLGQGYAGDGYDSSTFDAGYEGVCYLRSGAEVESGPKGIVQVKTFYADDTQLETKMAQVVEARAAAGLLPAGAPASAATVPLETAPAGAAPERLLAVFEPGEDRLTLDQLAGRLGLDRAGVRELARAAGAEVKKIRAVDGSLAWGVERAPIG